MSLNIRDMRFSYGPFQDAQTLKAFVPGLQWRHKLPTKSSRLIGNFHERLLARLTQGAIIRGRGVSEGDVKLTTKQILEVKAGHCRLQGRKNWTFGPKQLENMSELTDIDSYYTALFCYGLGSHNPEELSRQHGRNFITYAESMFVIFMKYSECLDLYQRNLMTLSRSAKTDRRILLFRHVLNLIHGKIPHTNIYSNIDLPDTPTLGLIGNRTRHSVRNIIIGVDVNPTSLIPVLDGSAWRERFKCNPEPVI